MNHFYLRNGQFFCEDTSIKEIAKKFGTPIYIYSKSAIQDNCRQFQRVFSGYPTEICYAVKANYNLSILKEIFSLGLGADVVSIGELERCLKAGLSGSKIVFSGVGKTHFEIERAIKLGVGTLNVESLSELSMIRKITEEHKTKVSINLRINPNIDVKTNPYIATGLYGTKFGIADEMVKEVLQTVKNHKFIKVEGLACHIGSQILELQRFAEAALRLRELGTDLKQMGYPISRLDLGGGLGISYNEKESVPSIEEYGQTLLNVLNTHSFKLFLEPGRSIIGNAGALVTEVIHLKQNRTRHFTIVDAAMNDLIRPCLYKAHHDIVPVEERDRSLILTDVVGPICETGDFLGLDRYLPESMAGDLLMIKTAGAYGSTMTSNYNTRPRVAEVLVSGQEVKLIRRRESLTELWQHEIF